MMPGSETERQDQKPKISKQALSSLILGIISVVTLPPLAVLMKPVAFRDMLTVYAAWLLPLAGLALGIIALQRIIRAKKKLRGLGLAFSSLLLSALVSFALAFFTISFVAQYNKRQIVAIDDVTHATTIRLLNPNPQERVRFFSILITGQIDGAANVRIEDYPEWHIASGKVYLKIGDQWYSEEYPLVEYKPINVNKGFLEMRYCLQTVPRRKTSE